MSEQYTLDTDKMRKCSYLLPDPGGEVVRQCLDEVERLRAANKDCIDWYESLKADYERLRAELAAEREACVEGVNKRRIADECVEGEFDRGYNMAIGDCLNAIRNRAERG